MPINTPINTFSNMYTTAIGQEGLAKLLDQFLEQKQLGLLLDPEQYIKYVNGDAEALIKIDMSTEPFHFWCYDYVHGRPMLSVTNILLDFAWNKGGEKEAYLSTLSSRENIDLDQTYEQWKQNKFSWLSDIGKENREKEQAPFLNGGSWVLSKEPFNVKSKSEAFDDAIELLKSKQVEKDQVVQRQEQQVTKRGQDAVNELVASAWRFFKSSPSPSKNIKIEENENLDQKQSRSKTP